MPGSIAALAGAGLAKPIGGITDIMKI
jgi:hypothetical protein